MKLFIYRETYPIYFSLEIDYEEKGLIVAEDIESAKEFLFQACFNGKGTYDRDALGDGRFPSILDTFHYYGEGSRKKWENDCREIFLDPYWEVWYEKENTPIIETDIEVSNNTKPGIYLKGKYWDYK